MESTLLFFLLLIGILIGGLLTLLFDARYFGRRVDAAAAQAQEARQTLRETEKRMARMAARELPAAVEPARPAQTAVSSDDQNKMVHSQLENARAEFHIMQGNLARVANQLDQMRSENQALQIRTASAETRSQVMRENFDKLSDAHGELQESFRRTSEKLAAAEVELRYQQKIALASASMPQPSLPANMPPLVVETTPAAKPSKVAPPQADGASAVEVEAVVPEPAGSPSVDAAVETAAAAKPAAQGAEPVAPAAPSPAEESSPAKTASRSLLQKINGIGPVFSRRLADAGVETYSDFSQLTADQIATILGLKSWQIGKIAGWVQQAIELAAESGDN